MTIISNNIINIYYILLDNYGNQNWWPVTGGGKFEIIVGAILCQNVSWKNVQTSLELLKINNLWNYRAIYQSNFEHLSECIKSSRYFNQKAQTLKNFMALVIEDFNGQEEKLFSLTLRDLRNTLLSINGIGPETADDIIVYAALKPSFIIDQYTKRIASRVGITPLNNSYSEFQTIFEKKLPKDQKLYGEFHALLDKHGSNICTKKNPLCEKCCLQNICKHYLVNK
ncbi:hypothetical protein M1N55_01470 [Dehalococcoidia bacterium]|nr:hypothetical protein [Dehalococcoidia bacterium]